MILNLFSFNCFCSNLENNMMEENSKESKEKEKDCYLSYNVHNNNNNNNNSNNNNNEEERIKNKANNSHLEITFQDNHTNYSCRIYFAREFDEMRRKTLKPPKFQNCPMSLYKDIEQSRRKVWDEWKIPGKPSNNVSGEGDLNFHQRFNDNDDDDDEKSDDVLDDDNNDDTILRNDEYPGEGGGGHGREDPGTLNDSIEENRNYFARSLSNSVQWEAKGGKSGSRFCKTLGECFQSFIFSNYLNG